MQVPGAKVSTSRGRLLLGENRQLRAGPSPSLTQPVDDVLGLDDAELSAKAEDLYPSYGFQFSAYGRFLGPGPGSQATAAEELERWLEELRLLCRSWMTEFAPRLLVAVHMAQAGQIAAVLAPELERIRYAPGPGPDEVPAGDLPALAAWCLVETLRRRPLVVRDCVNCGRPWLATTGQDHCQRPAVGSLRDCRSIAKEARFLASDEVRGYRREYKRLHELRRRGTISVAELDAWRRGNEPRAWQPYPEWLGARKGKKA